MSGQITETVIKREGSRQHWRVEPASSHPINLLSKPCRAFQ